MKKGYFFLLPVLLLVLQTARADRIETYPLQHRSADEVMQSLRPLLQPDEALSSSGNLLILRASDATHAQVQRLLQQIDRPLAQLRISVRQYQRGQADDRRIGTQGDIHVGTGQDANIEFEARSRQYSTVRENAQSLLVREGDEAWISTGEDRPYPVVGLVPGGAIGGVSWRAVRSGFRIRPRLQGDRVLLDVSVVDEGDAPAGEGRLRHQGLKTTVSGRLGEWITLGGVDDDQADDGRALLGTARQRQGTRQQIQIRVDRP